MLSLPSLLPGSSWHPRWTLRSSLAVLTLVTQRTHGTSDAGQTFLPVVSFLSLHPHQAHVAWLSLMAGFT